MNVTIYTLRSVAYAITEPSLVIVLIILGVLFYRQNRKTAIMQKMIIGESINSPLELTISQIVIGLFAGTLASLLLSYIGVMFPENSGIEFLFIVSILLMLFKPRFFCFSYSASILGFIYLVLRLITDRVGTENAFTIDLVFLFSMVGVLHFIEGLLVIIDGHKGAIPIFTTRDNKIIGGFALKRYWALPVALFIIYAQTPGSTLGTISVSTPEWWPLFKSSNTIDILKTAVLSMIPFYGVLGYSGVTFTNDKGTKAFQSGLGILFYGILLTFIAQLAGLGILGEITAIVFCAGGHELMLYLQRRLEIKRAPKYVSDEEGLMILEVAPESPAFKAGLKSGDKIIEVNGNYVSNEATIYSELKESLNKVAIRIKDYKGELKDINLSRKGVERLGLVLVPRVVPAENKIIKMNGDSFKDMLDKLKKK
ncbi:PDZ domain-containing protein [Alloiococcus sp. CFN-8]|uniref:PDZ domain-containing protein n=1 Tax=Alloiococcus sp. CFN-8 TaxID=3416081 RepID=UPI003CED9E76